MNQANINNNALLANAKSVAAAAASKLPKVQKRKSGERRELVLFYTLSATGEQVQRDPRLAVIKEFLDVSNPRRTGRYTSPRKDFVIQALFDAIVAKAK